MRFFHFKSFVLVSFMVGATISSYGSAGHTYEDTRTRFYQKKGLIVSEPLTFTDEREFPGNDPDLQNSSRTTVKDGLLYDATGTLLDTGGGSYIYAIDHNGTLYTGSLRGGKHHSYFLKSKPEKAGYGIGRNVACAGEVKVTQGKITYIDNQSGHYQPIEDQLKMAVHLLYKAGVLEPNVRVVVSEPEHKGGGLKTLSLESIISEKSHDILAPYQSADKRTYEHIETQRKKEADFQSSVAQLNELCPKDLLEKPFSDFFPHFQQPSKGQNDLGEITLDGRPWKAVLNNSWDDLPKSVFGLFGGSTRSWPRISNIEKGVVTRHATCTYSVEYAEKYLPLYLIPLSPER